jgi:uncharacterized protein
LVELFGHYRITAESSGHQIKILDQKIGIDGPPARAVYRRFVGDELVAQTNIMSDKELVVVGVFPAPPIFTPREISSAAYLKFKSPVVVDPRSEVIVYCKMPIEIGVFRQTDDEELMIDAFSPAPQRYALYGSPESGVVCRYADTEAAAAEEQVQVTKYYEALVRIRIRNEIQNVVKVTKVILPLSGVVLDHAHDDSWLPGSVEMLLDSSFGKDIVNVRYVDAKVKREDKTSVQRREESLAFLMDAGY